MPLLEQEKNNKNLGKEELRIILSDAIGQLRIGDAL